MKYVIIGIDVVLLISIIYLYLLMRKELKKKKPSRDLLLKYTRYFNILTIILAVLGILSVYFNYFK